MEPSKKSTESEASKVWVYLTYDELVTHIGWIRDPKVGDDLQVYYMGLVEESLPGGNVNDLIFWPDKWFNDAEMLHVEFSDSEIALLLMAWTEKRLVGAEGIELPELPESKDEEPPAVIKL